MRQVLPLVRVHARVAGSVQLGKTQLVLTMPADSRQGAHGRPKLTFLLLPVLLIGGVTGIFLYLKQDDAGSRRLDADLCQTEGGGIAGSATLLLDFRKPLEAAQLGVPGALLHDLSLELGANTELRVFVLTADADAPRQALARVCKPYDNADLSIPTAKDQRNIVRDCDDLPAQLPRNPPRSGKQLLHPPRCPATPDRRLGQTVRRGAHRECVPGRGAGRNRNGVR